MLGVWAHRASGSRWRSTPEGIAAFEGGQGSEAGGVEGIKSTTVCIAMQSCFKSRGREVESSH